MATEFVNIKGKVSWVHSIKKDNYDKWSVQIHPDAQSLEVIRDMQAAGLKNVVKKDEEGYYVRFHRIPEQEVKGKMIYRDPPKVFQDDGKTPFEGIVGDGSDATVVLETYVHGTPGGGKARACRWDSLIVHEAVPYVHKKEGPETNKYAQRF